LLIIALIIGDFGYGQVSSSTDMGLEEPVFYSAEDSIVIDVPNQIVRLYGKSHVTYDDVVLDAEIIEIDIVNNEVSAYFGLDSLGNQIGKPVFTQGGEEVICESLKYNFETEKGYITEVRAQQGEGYIHMAESKIHPNQEIHFKNGKYTTCDADKPHYHFQLSKAMVIPEKRIVTGPMHMRILNVPLPIAAPFAFLPNSETRKHGIIIPRLALASAYGSGIENLGYYIPLNDYLETYFYGTAFTTGTWGISNQSNYYKKYKYRGNITLKYERLKGYFYNKDLSNNYTIKWQHNQDAKAHPSIKFNSDINFISNNNPTQSLEIIPDNYFTNQINSSVNLTKNWKLNQFAGGWTLKSSLRQNTQNETYSIELPSFNLNVSRFDLGVLRKNKIGKKWYENITVTYNMNSANSITTPDSIFNFQDYKQVGDYALNGIKQNALIKTNLKPKSGWFTFDLSANYNEIWNFQSVNKAWDPISDTLDVNTLNGLQAARNVTLSGGLQSNFYGYYIGPGENIKARHVMSPNLSFSYRPDIGSHQQYQIDSIGNLDYYSPFDVSLYREATRGESGLIKFGLNNTLELKTRKRKDTLNKSYKQKRIIDAFAIGGSYDIFKDSMQLSDFTFSLRTSPVKFISIQSGWRLTPYDYDDLTGIINSNYAWNSGNGVGRITKANLTTTAKFQSKNNQKTNTEKDTSAKIKLIIPWKVNLSYNIDYSRNSNGVIQQDTFKLTQTLKLDGTLDVSTKWKFTYGFSYDIQNLFTDNPLNNGVSATNIGIWRDLHCWEAALRWSQIGYFNFADPNSGFYDLPSSHVLTFQINIKSSMFNAFLPEQNLRIPEF
jgi:hypothetical protein